MGFSVKIQVHVLFPLLLQLGPTNVQFIDRRVMFGQVPLHLTTTRVAMIRNNSLNHAFFQVGT